MDDDTIVDLVFWSKENNTFDKIEELLKSNYIDLKRPYNSKHNSDWDWPLAFYAVSDGNIEMMKLFLKYGLDINIKRDFDNWTFLHVAAYIWDEDMVKFLIENNFEDLEAKDHFNQDAIDLVYTYPEIRDLIYEEIKRRKIEK